MAFRLVAVLVTVSLIGSLPVHGGTCDVATAPCRGSQPHPMACCTPAHCRCDLSSPVQPVPNSLPARATTVAGHEIVKVASLPVDALILLRGECPNVRSTARAGTSLPGAAASYLLTHAFLI